MALSTVKSISLLKKTCNREASQRYLRPPKKFAVVTFGTEKSRFLEYKPSTLELMLKDGGAMSLDVSVVPSITDNRAGWYLSVVAIPQYCIETILVSSRFQ